MARGPGRGKKEISAPKSLLPAADPGALAGAIRGEDGWRSKIKISAPKF
jgi:hypothetical protein